MKSPNDTFLADAAVSASKTLAARFGPAPAAAVVAGSGLGAFVEALEPEGACPYASLPGFPVPAVAGHPGQAAVGRISGRRILVLCGRSHLYEGLTADEATLPILATALWGCPILVVTNAAGGVNPEYRPGDLMLIADHLNLTFRFPFSACSGPAPGGPAFPHARPLYDARLRQTMREAARLEHIPLAEGIYAGNLGPAFETPAEGRMLRLLGADAVGMSTVLETLAARQAGMRVVALSYISNSLVHKAQDKTTHQEVLSNSSLVLAPLKRLLARFFQELEVES